MKNVSPDNEKKGMIWIITPFVGLPIILILYGILNFVANSLLSGLNGDEVSSSSMFIFQTFKLILGIFGIVDVIFIPIGLVVGLIYFNKKNVVVKK